MWYWKENTEVPPENFREKKKNDPGTVVIWMEEDVPVQQWPYEDGVCSATPPFPCPYYLHLRIRYLITCISTGLKYDGDGETRRHKHKLDVAPPHRQLFCVRGTRQLSEQRLGFEEQWHGG